MISNYIRPAALLDELGITEPSEIVIETIAQHCGATIVYEKLAGCAARIVGADDRAIITVSQDSSRGRQRFSGAHELGHWLIDRGKVAFACSAATFASEWGAMNPEMRANRFAAELLLPENFLRPFARGFPARFDMMRTISDKFETSLLASAIRFVEIGDSPSMLICNRRGGSRYSWFVGSPLVPRELWPTDLPGDYSIAGRLLAGKQVSTPATTRADQWIKRDDASKYSVHEDSFASESTGHVFSLLWWEDEDQLLDLEADEEEEAE